MPTDGESFSDEFKSTVTGLQNYSKLQQKINYYGDWIKPNDLRNLLTYPQGDYLNLTGRLVVSLFSQPPK